MRVANQALPDEQVHRGKLCAGPLGGMLNSNELISEE